MENVNNIWQLVAFLGAIVIPLFFKYVFVDKPKNKKKDEEKKELENQIESLKDKEQDDEIKEMKSDISDIKETNNWIVERMKKKDDQEKHQISIKKKAKNIIKAKEFKIKSPINSELNRLIINSLKGFKELSEEIYACNFNICMEDLYESAENYLKTAKRSIQLNKLKIDEPVIFLEELEDYVIKPTLEKFIIDFKSLEGLENGVRRGRFAVISETFISSMVEKSIDNFTNYAKATH